MIHGWVISLGICHSRILLADETKNSFALVAMPRLNAPYFDVLQQPSGTAIRPSLDCSKGVHFVARSSVALPITAPLNSPNDPTACQFSLVWIDA
jgi:hypothetical protein